MIIGGDTRKKSSYNGLMAANKNTKKVLIHDAARPLINSKIIRNCIQKLHVFDAVTVAIKPNDTIVSINDNQITNVLIRELCRLEQTPQAFKYDVILNAHQKIQEDATDDIYLAHKYGAKCGIVNGSKTNFKITTNIDLKIAKELLLS